MQLQVLHETRYDYVPVVETAQHMCHLRPLSDQRQQLLKHRLEISPAPAQQGSTFDVFGNSRHFFSLQAPHSRLVLRASSLVRTNCSALPDSRVNWEQVRERFRYVAGGSFDPAGEFAFASPYVPRDPAFYAYARPSFPASTALLECAIDLMQRVHHDFEYDSRSTEVSTPALQALAQRRGVCQDFAHIMLGCLRAMGLAARYVSGYLLTQPAAGAERLVGGDASHAWVSVYLPDLPPQAQWCDLDPTNNRHGWGAPGVDYVRLALGRDYSDVSPVRGVIHGGAHHDLRVAVTVLPQEPFPARADPALQPQMQGQWQDRTQLPGTALTADTAAGREDPGDRAGTPWANQPIQPEELP